MIEFGVLRCCCLSVGNVGGMHHEIMSRSWCTCPAFRNGLGRRRRRKIWLIYDTIFDASDCSLFPVFAHNQSRSTNPRIRRINQTTELMPTVGQGVFCSICSLSSLPSLLCGTRAPLHRYLDSRLSGTLLDPLPTAGKISQGGQPPCPSPFPRRRRMNQKT